MNAVQRYYFDHNATTPVSPEVLEAMAPLMTEVFGNASSIHQFGQEARGRSWIARGARWRRCWAPKPEEIVFTSGGTEADNLAIFGVPGGHVITTTVEHPAVLASRGAVAISDACAGGRPRHGRSGRDPRARFAPTRN